MLENELGALVQKVNESKMVNIIKVCLAGKNCTKQLLEGETSKRKEYRAFCYAEKDLSDEDLRKLELSEVVLKQSTPIRVLHRRNVDVRQRTVHRYFFVRMHFTYVIKSPTLSK